MATRALWHERLIVCAIAALGGVGASAAFAEEPTRHPASEALAEVAQRETYALLGEREALLSSAIQAHPGSAILRWHAGFFHDGRTWRRFHEATLNQVLARQIRDYQRQREARGDALADHLALADWCRNHSLAPQEQAHLWRVLELSPDHSAARSRLGFERTTDGWTTAAQRDAEQLLAARREAALQKWLPEISKWASDLEGRQPVLRRAAVEKISRLSDPEAIPALERCVAPQSEAAERLVISTLAKISSQSATRALLDHAAGSPSLTAREEACAALRSRPWDTFVPSLLGSVYSPIVVRMSSELLPSGRLRFSHQVVREGQDAQQILQLNTEYRRAPDLGASGREARRLAAADAVQNSASLEQQVAAENLAQQRINDRLLWVLAKATDKNLPADPQAWWNWWNDHNEVFFDGGKAQTIVTRERQVSITPRTLPPPVEGGDFDDDPVLNPSPPTRRDCLAAGTPVWTIVGPRPIEQIRLGDVVLSRQVVTGELAYKPVLRTTIRPAAPLVQLKAGEQVLECSGGHPFWVAGDGWKKARDIEPGMVLIGAERPVQVSAASRGPAAPTYNLVVADFHTYFAGERLVLSHDNTVSEPVAVLAPGVPAAR